MQTQEAIAQQYLHLHAEKPWFGAGVEESLEPLKEELFHLPVAGRTIAGTIGHIIAWRRNGYQRIMGLPRETIKLNTQQDWPDYANKTKAEMLAELSHTKDKLVAAVRQFPADRLEEKLHPGHYYTWRNFMEGNVQHDVYHLGQINLLSAIIQSQKPTN